jgi:hypothetical protein
MEKSFEYLGEPDLSIAGLKIWIHKRQFPDSMDYYDGNWLYITATCADKNASVWINGPIILVTDIVFLLNGIETMYSQLSGEAELPCIEPELYVTMKSQKLGHIEMTVDITPDNLTQKHSFIFSIDQSYLQNAITDCKKILEKFPVKGK